MGSLSGKAAIVLGAAGVGNMGQAVARRLARDGARVLVAGRHDEPLRALSDEIGGAYALCDITSKAEVDAMIDEALSRFGRLDIGVNTTAWALIKPLEETTEQDLDKMSAVQFKGPIFFFQALLRGMENGGSIVQISSAVATILFERHAAYMGTKAGIDHVIRAIANEYGHRGIRANSISPGATKTPMAGEAMDNPGFLAALEREYPLGRIGTVDDIADAVSWVCSDGCFMTGQNLQVNGGLTLRRNPTFAELGDSASGLAHLSV